MKANQAVKIQVIDTTKEVTDTKEDDYYPPASPNFVYEDPYVTEAELASIGKAKTLPLKPKKPASAYFYYMKHNRCLYQRQHPSWHMKRIIMAIASDWAKLTDEAKSPYLKMAQEDSERYKEAMKAFTQTDTFKKLERTRKRNHKFRQRLRQKEQKDTMEKESFELFCQDHGGSKAEIEALWNVTDESIKEEYRNKAFENAKTIVTSSRSKRQIKLPSRFEDSSMIKTSSISAFENFIKAKKIETGIECMDKLKSEWKLLSDAEKSQFASNTSVNYKALDVGQEVFDDDSDE